MEKPSFQPVELFSDTFKKEVLDEMTCAEFLLFTKAHGLEVQRVEYSSEQVTPEKIFGLFLEGRYGHPHEAYEKTVGQQDPIWEAFGGLPNPTANVVYHLKDLPLMREWFERRNEVEKKGFFQTLERLLLVRRNHVLRIAMALCDVLEQNVGSKDQGRPFFFRHLEVTCSLRSCMDECKMALNQGRDEATSLATIATILSCMDRIGGILRGIKRQQEDSTLFFTEKKKAFLSFLEMTSRLSKEISRASFIARPMKKVKESLGFSGKYEPEYTLAALRELSISDGRRGKSPRDYLEWFNKPPEEYLKRLAIESGECFPTDEQIEEWEQQIKDLQGKEPSSPDAPLTPYRHASPIKEKKTKK